MSMARMPAGAHGAIWQFPHAALNWANGKRRVTCAKGLKEEYLMDLEKLIENAKVCCGDIETEDCSERCINPGDKREMKCAGVVNGSYTICTLPSPRCRPKTRSCGPELEQVKRDSLARGTRRAAVDETGNPL